MSREDQARGPDRLAELDERGPVAEMAHDELPYLAHSAFLEKAAADFIGAQALAQRRAGEVNSPGTQERQELTPRGRGNPVRALGEPLFVRQLPGQASGSSGAACSGPTGQKSSHLLSTPKALSGVRESLWSLESPDSTLRSCWEIPRSNR